MDITDLSETSSTGSPTTPGRTCIDVSCILGENDVLGLDAPFSLSKDVPWPVSDDSLTKRLPLRHSPPATGFPLAWSPSSIWGEPSWVSRRKWHDVSSTSWQWKSQRRYSLIEHALVSSSQAWPLSVTQQDGSGCEPSLRRHSVACPPIDQYPELGQDTRHQILSKDLQLHIDEYFGSPRLESDTGTSDRGLPLRNLLSMGAVLYRVEFKTGRRGLYYVSCVDRDSLSPRRGEAVIVEADRGYDLGKVVAVDLGMAALVSDDDAPDSEALQNGTVRMGHAKRLIRFATAAELSSLETKTNDELHALSVCRTKVKQKQLPMHIVGAEYQWDRRKLTFYFVAEQRIDFRDLVRDLFRKYKTRIWMCAVPTSLTPTSTFTSSSVMAVPTLVDPSHY